MSERIDLQEFVAGFIAESDELIGVANASLLEIETANRTGSARPRAVRELFRALHTIKGLAGMVGVEPIVELAHVLESLVRAADRAGRSLSPDAADASLRGVAAIAERVRAVEAQREPAAIPGELIDAIVAASTPGTLTPPRGLPAIAPPVVPPGNAQGWDAGLGPAERTQLAAGWRAHRRAWRMTFVPSEELAARGVSIGAVRAQVAALGELIKVIPKATPGKGAGIAFELIAISDAAPAALAEAAAIGEAAMVELYDPAPPAEPAVPEPAAPEPSRAAMASVIPGLPPGVIDLPAEPAVGGAIGRSLVRVELGRLDELQDQLSTMIVSQFRLEREIAAHVERGHDARGL
ncbi:MAG TPA: Hpt domain-containing protein, partial [Kofleriaceae bacterium]